RQEIHTKIAKSMEEKFPDIVAAQPALLADHFTEAGLIEKAVGYWLTGGEQSIARGAMSEAVTRLQKGLGGLSGGGGNTEREAQKQSLQIPLGHALTARRGYAAWEPGQTFARARQLCERLNQPPQLVLHVGQHMFHLVRGDVIQAGCLA